MSAGATFIAAVSDFVQQHELLNPHDKVLVAVSGGADSVALLRVLLALGHDCEVAHCNFHLRGAESDGDERFVAGLCRDLGVALHTRDFDVQAHCALHGVSVEMACRDLRYAWFEQLRQERGCRCMAVAHHQDDNVETFFLNVLRGTGVNGLAGIKPRNAHVVRPLLGVTRAQILDYLAAIHQDYRTDSTNASCDVKRNRVRNVVLPAITAQFPEAARTLALTQAHVAADAELMDELLGLVGEKLCRPTAHGLRIEAVELQQFKHCATLLFKLLQPHGFNYEQCRDAVIALLSQNAAGKHFASRTHEMLLNRDSIEVSAFKETVEDCYKISLNSSEISSPVQLKIQRVEGQPFLPSVCDGKRVVAFNTGVLNCREVLLRRWRRGDRFSPFGMRGSKLVSDLFVDQKMSELEKRDTWLLEADGTIVWVVGRKSSSAFSVAPGATDYLLLSLQGCD